MVLSSQQVFTYERYSFHSTLHQSFLPQSFDTHYGFGKVYDAAERID